MQATRRYALAILLPVLALAGCGGGEAPPEPPRVLAFQADPAELQAGDAAALSWRTQAALAVAIVDGEGTPLELSGQPAAEGSVSVTLDVPGAHTYTLTASGAPGTAEAVETVTITVLPIPGPRITAFGADPEALVEGESTTLTWATEHAQALTLVDDQGTTVDLTGLSVAAGSVQLTPEVDTTYTLTATGEGGEDVAETSVSVTGRPAIETFVVEPADPLLPSDTTVTLRWSTRNATELSLTDEHGQALSVGTEPAGSVQVAPPVSTRYTLTASGAGGTVTRELTVHVLAIVDGFTVTPAVVRMGDVVTLSWTTGGATVVEITGPNGYLHRPDATALAAGSTTLVASEPGEFVLRASSTANTMLSSAWLTVTERPLVRTFDVSPSPASVGEQVRLTWAASGATSVALWADGELLELEDASPEAGTADWVLLQPGHSTFELVVANDHGTDSRAVEVEVVPSAAVARFEALPTRTYAGGEVTLAWATTNAQSVRLLRDGVGIGELDSGLLSGTYVDTLHAEATYVLQAINPLGHVTESEPLTVPLGEPVIREVAVDPDRVAPGERFTLRWSSRGGEHLTVTREGSELPVHQADGFADVASGEADLEAPLETGEHFYLAVVRDAAGGEDGAAVPLFVSAGPIVRSLASSLTAATVNDTTELTWTVLPDQDGTAPTLTLTTVSPSAEETVLDVTQRAPATASVTLDAVGTWTFTLHATTGSGEDHTRTLTIDVLEAPELLAFTADPDALSTENGTVEPETTLSWEAGHATRVLLERYRGDGTYAPLVDVREGEGLTAGTLTVHPDATTVYRLTAENPLGAGTVRLLRVTVDAPRIDAFELAVNGQPVDEVVVGDTVDVSWTTRQADHVLAAPGSPAWEPIAGAFVDIGTTGHELPVRQAGTGGYAELTFPSDFYFPWEGTALSQVLVANAGYVGLNVGERPGSTNVRIPNANSPNGGILAPFWDDALTDTEGGRLFWERRTDPARGDYVVVQWTHYAFTTSAAGPSDINFQVWLFANGGVEFHYGPMSSTSPKYANAAEATRGLEYIMGRYGTEIAWKTEVPEGLTNTGVRWRLHQPASGSFQLTLPSRSTTSYPLYDVSLAAGNAQGFTFAHRFLKVHEPVGLESASFGPMLPETGETIRIEYRYRYASRVEVKTSEGTVLCSDASDAADGTWKTGVCEFTEAEPDTYTYLVEATGPVPHDVLSLPVHLRVYPPFGIHGFTADGATQAFVRENAAVRLAWEVEGAAALEILENGRPMTPPVLLIDPAGQGEVEIVPTGSATFTLRIADDETFTARTAEAGVFVYVGAARIEGFESSVAQSPAGSPVNLSWSTIDADTVRLRSSDRTYAGMTSGNTFHSIASDPDVSVIPFDDADDDLYVINTVMRDFAVPLDGRLYTEVQVSTDGFVILGPQLDANRPSNTRLPNPTVGSGPYGIIAPFWDNLERADNDARVVWKVAGASPDRHLIIEWNRYKPVNTVGEMTFQLVLHENGLAEVRYVDIAPAPRTVDLSWNVTGATRVRILDQTQAVIVDTDAGTACITGPCRPDLDMVRVTGLGDPDTWTLVAENETGVDQAQTYVDWYRMPEATLEVSAISGGGLQATWKTAKTTALKLLDAATGAVVLELAGTEKCGEGCSITSGSVLLPDAAAPATYELVAGNEWGERRVESLASAAGAPIIDAFIPDVHYAGTTGGGWYDGLSGATGNNADWDFFAGWSATVGWTNPDAAIGDVLGDMILFDEPDERIVAEGVSHLFRVGASPNGGAVVHPDETTTYELCAYGGGYTDCKEVTVVVVGPGSVLFTELMVDPVGAAPGAGQWFEVRNATQHLLDLSGWTVRGSTSAAAYTVPAGTRLAPGAHLVLAASADPAANGGLTPTLAYGAAAPTLLLAPDGDALSLTYGDVPVDAVAWDASWTATAGASWSLDGEWQDRRFPELNDTFVRLVGTDVVPVWCTAAPGEAYGDAGNAGSPGETGVSCVHVGRAYALDRAGGLFLDITATGQELPELLGSSASVQLSGGLGFTTQFFGEDVTELWPSKHGYVRFAKEGIDSAFIDDIPDSTGPDFYAAPYWAYLAAANPGSKVLWTREELGGEKVAIVQWNDMEIGGTSGAAGSATFQVQIWESGDIVFAYGDLRAKLESSLPKYRGTACTVGMENRAGSDGVRVSYKTESLYPYSGLRLVRQ